MFEIPEFATLARQINQVLMGKVIKKGSLGNSPRKFVWYNRTPDEFEALTQDQLIPGLGNAIAQDILFKAKLHPRHPIDDFTNIQRRQLYRAIMEIVDQVIARGGRYYEYDLHGNPGGYIRIMDKNPVGHPCPLCGQKIEKIQYLGGACYFCPCCQT